MISDASGNTDGKIINTQAAAIGGPGKVQYMLLLAAFSLNGRCGCLADDHDIPTHNAIEAIGSRKLSKWSIERSLAVPSVVNISSACLLLESL